MKKSCLVFVLLILTGCPLPQVISPGKLPTDPEDSPNTEGNIKWVWGTSELVESGLGKSEYTMAGFSTDGNEGNQAFCFENNSPCKRASAEVRAVIRNNPVAIESFQFNFLADKTYESVKLTAASITTAELSFNAKTGSPIFSNRVKKNLVDGVACDLNSSNSVGYEYAVGQERILTGIFVFEEASESGPNSKNFFNGYITAARVRYSGLSPKSGTVEAPFAFKKIPETAEYAEADFGYKAFTGLSDSILLSPQMGTPSGNNFIIGFCIQGTKVKAGKSRPLLYYIAARTYRPLLEKVSP